MLVNVQSQRALREYVVVKDMYSGPKADQYSIFANKSENKISYRIESEYSPMQNIVLHNYPDKKVIGKLTAHQTGPWYQAAYEVLDTRKQPYKWFTGLIKRRSTWFDEEYDVHLAERKLAIIRKTFSSKFRIYNEAKKLLAMYRKRSTFFGVPKYDLQIFSNEFPDSIYFLSLAAQNDKVKTVPDDTQSAIRDGSYK